MRRLQGDKWALLVESFGFLVAARLALRLFSLQRVLMWIRPRDRSRRPGSPRRIAWAVEAWARRVPWFRNCLVQALAAHAMLRRRGFASSLWVGVRAEEGHFLFHAWVELSGQPLLGEGPSQGFLPLQHWP